MCRRTLACRKCFIFKKLGSQICGIKLIVVTLRHKIYLVYTDMKTTATIKIAQPSKEFVAFMEKAQQIKKLRMQDMRERFLQGKLQGN